VSRLSRVSGINFNGLRRSAAGVLVSDVKGRDVKIDAYTLSFHGRLLVENAEVALNYGQRCVRLPVLATAKPIFLSFRYGLLGENGSGKVFASVSR
jgi:ATP-binding cassette, subfamily F, member 2